MSILVITMVELVGSYSSLDGTIKRFNRFFIIFLIWGTYETILFKDFSHGTFKYINMDVGKYFKLKLFYVKMVRNEITNFFSLEVYKSAYFPSLLLLNRQILFGLVM